MDVREEFMDESEMQRWHKVSSIRQQLHLKCKRPSGRLQSWRWQGEKSGLL
jgi:hypothetical protein